MSAKATAVVCVRPGIGITNTVTLPGNVKLPFRTPRLGIALLIDAATSGRSGGEATASKLTTELRGKLDAIYGGSVDRPIK